MKIIFLILIFVTPSAYSNDIPCSNYSVSEHKELADLVVIGKLHSGQIDDAGNGFLIVEVLRKWKGKEQKMIKLYSNMRWPISLTPNVYYLFYLRKIQGQNAYYVKPCEGRWAELVYAGADLIELGNPTWSSSTN